jgi:NADH dehydrogenase
MILVVGATGDVGGNIARRLLERQNSVRVLVREGSNYAPLIEAGAEAAIGDLKDSSSLGPACAGIETVVTTANSAKRGGEDNPQTVDTEGNRNLIEAAEQAGVRQFVFVSANGADPESPSEFLRAKGLTEQRCRRSSMTHTILLPDVYMDIWVPMVVGMPLAQGRPVTLVGDGSKRHSFVFSHDVAAYGAAVIGHPEANDRTMPIGGPEALSWREVVETYERELGRSIPVETVSPGEPVPGFPDMIAQLMASLEMYESVMDMTEISRTFGVEPTSLAQWIRAQENAP